MRTLINSGELNPGEERRPVEETWTLTDLDRTLVAEARPYVIALDHVGLPDEERTFLQQIGRGSALAAPIRSGGRVWGVLEAYSAVDAPPFTDAHVRFAEALCAQVATAIGRAQLFSRLEDLAYRDPLTGLPNRRALDERMEDAVAAAQAQGTDLALVFCDLDGLKDVNDRLGHEAGDRALVAAGQALVEAGDAFPGSMTCRLGGDEFCVLMEGHGAEAARELARDAAQRLVASPAGPLTMSSGVACLDDEHRRASDLFRAADAAQYAAKRVGGDKLFVAEPGIPTPPAPAPEPWSRRRFRDAGPAEREALVRYLMTTLDGDLLGAGELARLEAVADSFAEAFDAARWAISRRAPRLTRGPDAAGRRAPRPLRPGRGRHALHRPRRGLRARRLPADRGHHGDRRRLRDRGRRRGRRPRRAGAARRSGASPRSRPPRRSRPTGRRGSSSSTPTRGRTRCPPRSPSCACWPARPSAAAGPRSGYAPDAVTSEAKSSKTST